VSAQLVILLWTLRRLAGVVETSASGMSRLADGLALLTDTTEAGLAAIVHQYLKQAGTQGQGPAAGLAHDSGQARRGRGAQRRARDLDCRA
jgi:hypothetical protein